MELDVKKSKALKISLLVLVAIILLAIGATMGSHFGRNRGYGNIGYGCGRFNNFDRYIENGRQDGGRFRMMSPRGINTGQTGQILDNNGQFQSSTVPDAQSTTTAPLQ